MTPPTPQPPQPARAISTATAAGLAEATGRLDMIEMFLHAALIGGMVDALEARCGLQHADGADVATDLALQIARTGQPNAAMRLAARKCHGLLRDAIVIGGLPLHQAVEAVQGSPSGGQAFREYLFALVPEAFAAKGVRA